MQRGFKVFIISGALFLTSIVVFFIWGMSFSSMFVQNNPSLSTNQITLDPLMAYNSSIFINSTDRPLTITIDSTNNNQMMLNEVVTDTNGKIVSNSTFQKTYFTTITPNSTGKYDISVFNMDKNNKASFYLFFGNLPFLKENGEIDLSSFSGLVLGVMLFIAGLVSFIIGIILYLKDRNKERYHGYIPR
jgi:hypothetical protein